jgi:hypothetical protein
MFLRLKGNWYWAPQVIEVIVEKLTLLVLVALLWYAVSMEITGRGRSVLTAKTRPVSIEECKFAADSRGRV